MQLMPLIISKISLKYGFRYIPIYQVLDNDVHLYPPDVFSSCYNTAIMKCSSINNYNENQIRYSYHLCAHSWYESKLNKFSIVKSSIIKLIGKNNAARIKKFFGKKNNYKI